MARLNADDWPSSARAASRVAAVTGYGLALAILVLRLLGGGSLLIWVELPGSVALTVAVAVPSTLALLAFPGRPALLVAASLISIAMLFLYPLLGLPMAVLGAVWLWSYSRTENGDRGRPLVTLGAMLLVAAMWLGAVIVLFVHVDPRCAEQLSDGTVRTTDPAVQGLVAGWAWEVPSSSSGSASLSGDVVAAECTSDTIVWWEALASLILATGAVGLGVVMTDRLTPSLPSQN